MAIYHQQIYAIDVAVGMIRDAIDARYHQQYRDHLYL